MYVESNEQDYSYFDPLKSQNKNQGFLSIEKRTFFVKTIDSKNSSIILENITINIE
jgi:hypothetical protein